MVGGVAVEEVNVDEVVQKLEKVDAGYRLEVGLEGLENVMKSRDYVRARNVCRLKRMRGIRLACHCK
jgi:hypothetical protein